MFYLINKSEVFWGCIMNFLGNLLITSSHLKDGINFLLSLLLKMVLFLILKMMSMVNWDHFMLWTSQYTSGKVKNTDYAQNSSHLATIARKEAQ